MAQTNWLGGNFPCPRFSVTTQEKDSAVYFTAVAYLFSETSNDEL